MELVKGPVPVPSVVWLSARVGLTEVLQQTPRALIEEPPSVVTLPPEVALFSVMAGLLYGSWVDGMSAMRLVVSMLAFVAVLAALLLALHRRQTAAAGS